MFNKVHLLIKIIYYKNNLLYKNYEILLYILNES